MGEAGAEVMKRKSTAKGVAAGAIDPLLIPIQAAFAEDKDVAVGRVLSANGLKTGGKLFAGISKGRLLLKLPAEDVARLVANEWGAPFAAGGGRVMREWVTIGGERQDAWVGLARQAKSFVVGQNAAATEAAPRRAARRFK